MFDRLAVEAFQFNKNLPEDVRQSGLELGHALLDAISHIPMLETLVLEGPEAQILAAHLATLRTMLNFVKRAEVVREGMPAA